MIALKSEDARVMEALAEFMVDGVAKVSVRRLGEVTGLTTRTISHTMNRQTEHRVNGRWSGENREPSTHKFTELGREFLEASGHRPSTVVTVPRVAAKARLTARPYDASARPSPALIAARIDAA